MSDKWYEEAKKLANEVRVKSLRMTSNGKASHIGSCLSVADIFATLYSGTAKISAQTVNDPARDRVIISKGHVAAAYYAVLESSGFIDSSDLDSYCQDGAMLGGHVSVRVNGVEVSTGSLGHGLPYGVGLALGLKVTFPGTRVFVVMSDGELDEGTTWESALIANHHKLENLVVVVDRNNLQSFDTTENTLALEPLADKWRAFGWTVVECDGHDVQKLREALFQKGPLVVLATTVKGQGVSFMQNSVDWHYRSPSEEALTAALSELGVKS
ncbi:MAG: transketolase [Gammaproteobacteria bacterium]